MQLKYMESKSWLTGCWGTSLCFTLPSSALKSWNTTFAIRRPAPKVRGVHRCYLRQDPVFLRSLLRLAGRKIDRRFHFSRLCRAPVQHRGQRNLRVRTATALVHRLNAVRQAQEGGRGRWPACCACSARRPRRRTARPSYTSE